MVRGAAPGHLHKFIETRSKFTWFKNIQVIDWATPTMRRPRSARDRSDMLGSELVVRTLARHGVTTIFGLGANQTAPLYAASIDAQIRIAHARQEAAAVFMAEH